MTGGIESNPESKRSELTISIDSIMWENRYDSRGRIFSRGLYLFYLRNTPLLKTERQGMT